MKIQQVVDQIVTLGEINRQVSDIFSDKGIYIQPRYLTHRARQYGIRGIVKIANGEEENRGLWVMTNKTAERILDYALESSDIYQFHSLLSRVR